MQFLLKYFGAVIGKNIKISMLGLLLTLSASAMAEPTTVFLDDFSDATLNPLWSGALPDAPGAGGYTTPETYLGFPNYQFQILGVESVLRMSNSLSDLQRVGWSLQTNFCLSDFRYDVRFNSLVQSSSTSIDAFMEIWILDAADSNRYDIVSLFGGSYGSDRRFRASSSIAGTSSDQDFAFEDNTYYHLVLSGNSTNNVRASLFDDQGNELAWADLGHNSSVFTSGFKIAISQGMYQPLSVYPSDVAVDYVWLATSNNVSFVSAASNPGVQISWPSQTGRWYQLQLQPRLMTFSWAKKNNDKNKWEDFGDPIFGTGSNVCTFIPESKLKPHMQYRVQQLP